MFLICVPFVDARRNYELTKLVPFTTDDGRGRKHGTPGNGPYVPTSNEDYIERATVDNCDIVGKLYLCDNLLVDKDGKFLNMRDRANPK